MSHIYLSVRFLIFLPNYSWSKSLISRLRESADVSAVQAGEWSIQWMKNFHISLSNYYYYYFGVHIHIHIYGEMK